MASTTKSLRSSTANKRPTTAIAEGQIALNTNATSPGLYFKDSTGASIIKIGPVHIGTTAPNVSPAGSSGNSNGETWLDTSLTPNGWKVWTGAAWVNATPVGSATVQGLLELATDAETQAGSDTARAVTPAGLQSKVSDSTSTTSSTTIASSTAVKSAYDLANAALPKSGGTVTGNLEIGTSGSLTFEGATADAFETTLAVVNPTADRTITLPNATGTVVLDNNGQTVQFGLGAVATPSITFTGDINTGIYSPEADTLAFAKGGVEAMRIDSSGRLLVGTSTTASYNHLLQVRSDSGTVAEFLTSTETTDLAAYLAFSRSRGSAGSPTAVSSGDNIGTLFFSGYSGSVYTGAAEIKAEIDGTPGVGDMPGRLVFSTTADGAANPTERMRIDSSGRLLVGTSSPIQDETGLGVSAAQNSGGSGVVTFRNSSTSSADSSPVLMCRKAMSTTSSSARFIQFSANEAGQPMGYIGGNGANNVQFVSTSDIREKENIEPFAEALSKIMALEVVSFDWKKSKEHVNAGFIAQNVETVMPEYVVENASGGIKEPRKGVTGGMSAGYVAVLTAALQEAVAKIETLEAKVAALESA